MSEAKHTPGPWFYDGTHVFVDSLHQVCCGRAQYECCGNPEIEGDYGPIADTSEKDAPLIAAAPDLYAALERIVSSVSRGPSGDVCQTHDFEDAKTALAKARGEST